jgi:large subunit ribosomal protein L21
MFAVIRSGGRQYRVAANDVIEIDRISGDVGDQVDFDQVLVLGGEGGTTVGSPVVAGASVAGEVIEHRRGAKVIAFKMRRRKNSRRTRGHRQHYTLVRITDILTDGKKAPKKAAKPKPEAKPEPKVAAEPKAEPRRKPEAKPKTEAKPAKAEVKAKPAKAEAKEKKPPKAPAKPAEATPFKRPKGEPDDLKKITGVGPVLEGKLNAIGITRFDQIAAFTAKDLAKVDELLNFKGRAERDDWVGQAKKLAKGG